MNKPIDFEKKAEECAAFARSLAIDYDLSGDYWHGLQMKALSELAMLAISQRRFISTLEQTLREADAERARLESLVFSR